MNKKLRMLPVAALTLALLAGCQSSPSQAPTQTPAPAQNVEETQTPAPAQTSDAPMPAYAGPEDSFRPGTWQGEGMYYFFDMYDGSTVSMENGTGMAFTYEMEGETVTFHMGSADDSTPATVLQSGDTVIELQWADGRKETLHFVSGEGAETFSFFTDEELCDLAVAYYQSANGSDTPVIATATANPDSTVFIQLSSDQGDHLSNLAQYDKVDRLTAVGTDAMTGEDVRLNG